MKDRLSWLLRARLFSPGGFLLRAAVLTALFLAAHLAGLREYTSIICGTSPTGRQADVAAVTLGAAYGVLYFLFVLAVPALVIGAAIFLALALAMRPRRRSAP